LNFSGQGRQWASLAFSSARLQALNPRLSFASRLESVFWNMAITFGLKKSGGSLGYVSLLGYFFGLFAAVMIVATCIDAYRENMHAKWPVAVATIAQETVQKIPAGSRSEWFIELVLLYRGDGRELASSARSRGGAFWEEFSMRRWVSRHPPGTSLQIRYDPQNHNSVVPDAGDMPEAGPQALADLTATLFLSALSFVLIFIGRWRQRRQVEPR